MSQHLPSASPSTSQTRPQPPRVPLLRESEFADVVLASPVPVLVDFGAEWCPPCRVIEPLIEKIAARLQGQVRVVRMDADESPAIAARYRVRSLPTVISFSGGQELRRHTGATTMDVLVRLLPGPT